MELEFEDGALVEIARQAIERKSGARGLRAIIEGILLDIMFELPIREDVRKCVIKAETVRDAKAPDLVLDTSPRRRKQLPGVKPEALWGAGRGVTGSKRMRRLWYEVLILAIALKWRSMVQGG